MSRKELIFHYEKIIVFAIKRRRVMPRGMNAFLMCETSTRRLSETKEAVLWQNLD